MIAEPSRAEPSVQAGSAACAGGRESAQDGLRIAVVVDPSTSHGRELAAGAVQYAREVGDWRVVVAEGRDWTPPDALAGDVDGIVASFDDPSLVAAIRGRRLPAVAVGRNDPNPRGEGRGTARNGRPSAGMRIPFVTTDDEKIAELAAAHLLDRGLRGFAFHGDASDWAAERCRAFERRIAAAGFPCARLLAADDRAALAAWLEGLPKPVGMMACDDSRARDVLEACRDRGLRVPDDVAVIGVDDDEFVCELVDPTLTSVAQASRRIGYEAARLLDRLLRPRRFSGADRRPSPVPRRLLVEPTGVVPRRSTATLAVTDPVVAEVIRVVRARACDGLSITELVRMTGLSRWVLDDRFKRSVGHSIHDDMINVKLAEAQRLAAATDLPLKTVARRAGFRAVSYMTTVFRRHLATTPARFRRAHQRGLVQAAPEPSEPVGRRAGGGRR